MGEPDTYSTCLGKGVWVFSLGRRYLHVCVEQELTVRLGLSLLSLGGGGSILVSSAPCFSLSYRDKFVLFIMSACKGLMWWRLEW